MLGTKMIFFWGGAQHPPPHRIPLDAYGISLSPYYNPKYATARNVKSGRSRLWLVRNDMTVNLSAHCVA